MNNLPARTGLDWVRQGFRLFFSQPGILMSLMFGFLLLTLLMSIIPVLKVVAILVLNAVYPSIFLGAVAEVDAGRRVTGAALRSRFSKQALGRQMMLCLIYALFVSLAFWAASLVDGGTLEQLVAGKIQADDPSLKEADTRLAALVLMAAMAPAGLVFWFSSTLASWKQMGLVKALFFALVGMLRAIKPLLMYALAWIAVLGSCMGVLSLVAGQGIVGLVLFAIMMPVLVGAIQCSWYACFRDLYLEKGESAPSLDTV